VVTFRVRPPWGDQPIGITVGVRLHRKGGPTTLDLAEEIITEIASWLSQRSFSLSADGAYASLARRPLPRTTLTSRMRRDTALYEAPPPRTGKPGRPRKKGKRLPTPVAMAAKLRDDDFTALSVDFRGKARDLLVRSCPVPRYTTDPDHLVSSSSFAIPPASCTTTFSLRPTSRRSPVTSLRCMRGARRSSA